MSDPVIEMVNATRTFGTGTARVTALDNVSFSMPQGARVAIVGPSGSGKTTLLNLVGVLDRPSAGTVTVLGDEVSRLSERAASAFRRERLGFVFQDDALIPEITVFENVELPLVLLRVPSRERRQRVARLMEQLQLTHRTRSFPTVLSAGEKQRVAVARAVIHGPQVLLADEPTSHLDSTTAEAVVQLMEGLAKESNIAVLVATHDPRVFSRFDTHLRLNDGRVDHSPPATDAR